MAGETLEYKLANIGNVPSLHTNLWLAYCRRWLAAGLHQRYYKGCNITHMLHKIFHPPRYLEGMGGIFNKPAASINENKCLGVVTIKSNWVLASVKFLFHRKFTLS